MNIKNKLNLVELAGEMAETMLLNVTLQSGLKSEDIIEDFGSENLVLIQMKHKMYIMNIMMKYMNF